MGRFDANGERSTGAGPTPLLRQQLLAGTPTAGLSGPPSTAGAGPRTVGKSAVTPAEVRALREEIASLRSQVGGGGSVLLLQAPGCSAALDGCSMRVMCSGCTGRCQARHSWAGGLLCLANPSKQ